LIFPSSKIVLGTAQLGLKYGVTNKNNIPTNKQCFKILELAYLHGVKFFDTAPSYNSEIILGDFIKSHRLSTKINILTKISSLKNNFSESLIKKNIENSLSKLNTAIHTLFFHDPNDFKIFIKYKKFFLNLKKIFPIKNIGFSLFCRSVFLQGLLLNKASILNMPKKIKLFQSKYFELLKKLNIDPLNFILSFLNNNKNFNYFIFGIDNIKQLKKIFNYNFDNKIDIHLIRKINFLFNKKYQDPRIWI
jgi:aryl-alcohol dehydrogenase-like predicted oxidoreductase